MSIHSFEKVATIMPTQALPKSLPSQEMQGKPTEPLQLNAALRLDWESHRRQAAFLRAMLTHHNA